MQLNRCPVCHHRIALEALVQDEAGRELMGLLVSDVGWANGFIVCPPSQG